MRRCNLRRCCFSLRIVFVLLMLGKTEPSEHVAKFFMPKLMSSGSVQNWACFGSAISTATLNHQFKPSKVIRCRLYFTPTGIRPRSAHRLICFGAENIPTSFWVQWKPYAGQSCRWIFRTPRTRQFPCATPNYKRSEPCPRIEIILCVGDCLVQAWL